MSHFEWEDIDINAGNTIVGIISNIDYDNLTADVEEIGVGIPIHYHCDEDAIEDSGKSFDVDYPNEQDELGASAFTENDEVLVMYRRINDEDPIIVGFPDEAKACWIEGLFSIVYEHNGVNKYLIYDPLSKSVKTEDEDGRPDNYYSAPAYELVENDEAYYSDDDLIIASFYDWNDAIWIYRNSLKWGEETHQDHVFQTQFQFFSIPGQAEDIRFAPDGATIILDRSGINPYDFYVARMSEGDDVADWWHRWYIYRSGDKYYFSYTSPYTKYFDGMTADENWMAVKWDIRDFSFGDLTEGGGTGGAHLPVRTWGQVSWPSDYTVLLYDYDYNATIGEYHYGPFFDPPSVDLNDGFATANVLWGTYPGTGPSVADPYVVPLGSQVWYGCCKSIVGVIDCRPDADCGYPGSLHCSGLYCPSYTCNYPYTENQSWAYDWRSELTVYGVKTDVGEYKSCTGEWGATKWERIRFTSAPWLCDATATIAFPLSDDYLKSGTCDHTYTHSKSVFFDANLPIYLVVENSSGSGTEVWDVPTETWIFTSGESLNDYYTAFQGVRDATLYIKDSNGDILEYSCEVNIQDYSGTGRGHGIIGGKIFVAWGSSGIALDDERNDHVLVFYDIAGAKKFVSNGTDVTTKILSMISGLEFMEGGQADIDNVKFVSTRFSPKIALLHEY